MSELPHCLRGGCAGKSRPCCGSALPPLWPDTHLCCPPSPGTGSGAHPVRPSLREVRARRGETARRQLHVPLPELCVPYKGLTGSTRGCSLGCPSCSSLWGADPAEPCRDSCWWRLPGLFSSPTIVALPHGAPGHSDRLKWGVLGKSTGAPTGAQAWRRKRSRGRVTSGLLTQYVPRLIACLTLFRLTES